MSFIDISRAYFCATTDPDDPTYVELPIEDPEHGVKVGLLLKHMYGTRKAADGWHSEYAGRLVQEVGIEVDPAELTFCCAVQTRGRYADGHTHVFEIECEHEPDLILDQREVAWAGFCPAERLSGRPLIAPVRLYLSKRAAARET